LIAKATNDTATPRRAAEQKAAAIANAAVAWLDGNDGSLLGAIRRWVTPAV
jgi:hypothetical protein